MNCNESVYLLSSLPVTSLLISSLHFFSLHFSSNLNSNLISSYLLQSKNVRWYLLHGTAPPLLLIWPTDALGQAELEVTPSPKSENVSGLRYWQGTVVETKVEDASLLCFDFLFEVYKCQQNRRKNISDNEIIIKITKTI